ncbi:unnamed protein product [Rhizopus stolonifer]
MTIKQTSLFSFRKSTDDLRRNSLKITTTTPSFRKKVTSLFTVKTKSTEIIISSDRSPTEIFESPLESPTVNLLTPPTTPSVISFNKEETGHDLAGQVKEILGSTLDQVDMEIDKDWEKHRNVLQETLDQNSWKIIL